MGMSWSSYGHAMGHITGMSWDGNLGGRAQVTPENPMSVHELGFDSVWVHSGYFDIIQQTRALGRGHHGGALRHACMTVRMKDPSWPAAFRADF
jgi:hypothetical protein